MLITSRSSIHHRCMMDSDDEVRDRATFYFSVLKQKQLNLNAAYILNGLYFYLSLYFSKFARV